MEKVISKLMIIGMGALLLEIVRGLTLMEPLIVESRPSVRAKNIVRQIKHMYIAILGLLTVIQRNVVIAVHRGLGL